MLSIDECKDTLNRPDLSDEEVETIRDAILTVCRTVLASEIKKYESNPKKYEQENCHNF